MTLAADHDTLAPFLTASSMCSSHLLDGSRIDQRALRDALPRSPSPTFSFCDFLGQFLGEGVIDTGPAPGCGWRRRRSGRQLRYLEAMRALHGRVQIRVVEHDEGRVAAELERRPSSRSCAHCRIRSLPISVEPVKVSMRTSGLEVISPPIALGLAGDDIEHARRHAGALGKLRQRQRGERRLRSRACRRRCNRRRAPAPALRVIMASGEVPRRDGRDNADRLLQHEDDARCRPWARDGLADRCAWPPRRRTR